jgi:hypothetical protein
MAFYPPHANFGPSYDYNPFIGIQRDHHDVDWDPESPRTINPRILRRDSSLESINRDNSSSGSKKKVKWTKNVKSGRNTVGCMAFQRGCSAFPTSFDDAADGDVGSASTTTRSFLQKFADVAISNVQKCGVGIGHQCEGRGVNVTTLSSFIGGEMCTKCGVNDGDGHGFAYGRCPQCQTYFGTDANRGNCGLRSRCHQVQSQYGTIGTMRQNQNYHAKDMTTFQESRDAITESRDAIDCTLKPRLDFLSSEQEMFDSRQYGYQEPMQNRGAACGYYDEWDQEAIGSTQAILKNRIPNENDRYAMNYNRQKHNGSLKRISRSGNKRTMKEKTKLVGRCVVKSLSNPIGRLKQGMQRNGAKRILTITRGR